jgi:hypothetical protein
MKIGAGTSIYMCCTVHRVYTAHWCFIARGRAAVIYGSAEVGRLEGVLKTSR